MRERQIILVKNLMTWLKRNKVSYTEASKLFDQVTSAMVEQIISDEIRKHKEKKNENLCN